MSLATPPPRLHGADNLRAFAISYVFLFHYMILSHAKPTWLPAVAKFGWTGVDLFFVLSGYLISSQLFTQLKKGTGISLKQFFLKRFFRIIPAFLVTLGLYFLFPSFREKEALPPLWKFLTFTQNFGLDLKNHGTFSHAWSLCVEEHFYLVLPLILLLLQKTNLYKKGIWLVTAFFIAGIAIRLYSYSYCYLPVAGGEDGSIYWYQYIYYPTYTRLDGLLAGVSVAALYQYCPAFNRTIARYANLCIVVGLVILIIANQLCSNQQDFNASVLGFPLIAVGYGLVVAGAVNPTSILQWHSKLSAFIASLSYSIYLTHKGIIHITFLVLANASISSSLMLVTCMVTCTVGALLMHLVVEKPFMRLRNRVI